MKTLTRIALILSVALAGSALAQPATEKDPKAQKMTEAPKPAPELAQMANAMAGTWNCTGKGFAPDGTEHAMQATLKSRLDLDKFWIHDSLEVKMVNPPKGANMPQAFKSEMFTTFDANAKKWRRIAVDSMGGTMVGSADVTDDKVLEFQSAATGPMGTMMVREKIDKTDPKVTKVTGERSTDEGKTWQNDYQATCKR